MAKAYFTRGLCYHISYSSDDLATHFGVHVQTIREWVHRGLEPIDDKKTAFIFRKPCYAFYRQYEHQMQNNNTL